MKTFQTQLKKLIDRFDKKFYPPEVVSVIFNEVKTLSDEWLNKTVSIFLAQHKPPLLPEFREAARIEKDRLKMNLRFPTVSSESMFTQTQITFLFKLTQKIIAKEVPKGFIELFVPLLEDVIRRKDRSAAEQLFKEVSENLSIPYESRGAA